MSIHLLHCQNNQQPITNVQYQYVKQIHYISVSHISFYTSTHSALRKNTSSTSNNLMLAHMVTATKMNPDELHKYILNKVNIHHRQLLWIVLT